jgi:plastocyanin
MTSTEEGLMSTVPRARWARLAVLGFLMAAIAPMLMLGAALAWGLSIGDDAGFFLISAAVGLGAAAFVRQPRPWQRAIGLVLGLFVGLMLFWTMFGLFAPDSFFDFVPGVLVMPGVLIGLAAGIAAMLAQRKGHVTELAEGGERNLLTIVPILVVALVAISAIVTITGRETVADDITADHTVQMSDFEFGEDRYEFSGGDTVLIVNDDPFSHTFTIDALDIDVSVGPGSEKVVTIPDEPGDYILYCEPHTDDPDDPSDDDMAARIELS